MTVKFLFMDEKYADQGAPPKARATSLTGLLVPARTHPEFRRQYYELLTAAIGSTKTKTPLVPHVHAASLLPDPSLRSLDIHVRKALICHGQRA